MSSHTTRRSSHNRIDDEDGYDDQGTSAAAAGHDVTSADDESEVEWNGAADDGDGEEDDDEDEEEEDDDEDEGSDDSMDSTADMEVSNANDNDDFETADGEDTSTTSRRRTRSGNTVNGSISTFFTSGGRQAASGGGDGEKKRHTKKGKGGTKRKDRSERAERIRNRRRKIADVREDDDLDESTRKARDAERERASHIIDFEQLEDVVEIDAALAASSGNGPAKEPLLCLNVQADGSTPTGEAGTETAPVFVHEAITGKLKKHQIIGARFLWSHIAVEPNGFGCVLADFMGLGKTLQVITVVQAFLAKKRLNKDNMLVPRHKHVLILAPTICVRNWEAEVVKWLGKKEARRMGLTTLESSREKKMTDRIHVVKQWHKRGGLLIMGYELYRILVLQSSGEEKIAVGNQKYTQQIKEVYKCLANPGPDLIVLDEGHRVRDHKSKLVKALGFVKTARRIILTGYPLQNHLEEYWTMVNFARPDYLGTLEEFKNRFVDPIENAQCIDSSEADLRLARQRAYVLTRELKPLVLRRDQQYLFKQLPPKKEWVLLCKLSEPQAQLYRAFLEQGVPKRGENNEGYGGKVDVLGGYHISLAISNHPDVLCESYNQLEEEMRRNPDKFNKKNARFQMHGEDIDGDLGFLDLPIAPRSGVQAGAAPATLQMQKQPGTASEDSDVDILEALAAPTHGGPFKTLSLAAASAGPNHRLKFAEAFMRSYERSNLEASGKMMILMQLLSECQEIGDRVILFSQSIPTLNTIEKMIAQANRGQRRHSKRLSYLRIDGSTPQQERFRMIGQFNDLEEDVDIIMISTKAGGEGINLCAGNRIIIFDVCWNPCNDSQSMCRSYRFGQTKPVFVYRFVTSGTMEKKVYDLQIRKEGVAKRIVDEKTMERKFKSTDLQNYFNIQEFEDSLKQQYRQKKPAAAETGITIDTIEDLDALSPLQVRPSPEEDGVLQRVLAKFSGQNNNSNSQATGGLDALSPDTDTSSAPAPESGWIVDWFEQETMFEEDLDQQCSPTEQQEIMESHVYLKAIRRLRAAGSHLISREGILVVKCQYCQVNNEVYPEATTKVPVPRSIDCMYCKRPTLTAGAAPAPPPPAMPPGYAGHLYHHGAIGNFPRPFPGAMGGSNGAYVPGVSAPPSLMVNLGAAAQAMPAGANGGVAGAHDPPRQLPAHLMAIYQQQQQAQRERERIYQEKTIQQQLAVQKRMEEMRRKERQSLQLKDRCLLVLRRGMTGCQELKRSAERCGAKIAIEVSSQTTDIVSAMTLPETLKFLKLTKLPKDVDFRDDTWLRNEIAKVTGLPLANGAGSATTNGSAAAAAGSASSPDSTHTDTSRTGGDQQPLADTSSDMIDLLDSDDEGAVPSAPTNANGVAQEDTEQDEDEDDDDVIEIL